MGEAAPFPTGWRMVSGQEILATVYNDVIHILHMPSNDFWKHRVHHGVHKSWAFPESRVHQHLKHLLPDHTPPHTPPQRGGSAPLYLQSGPPPTWPGAAQKVPATMGQTLQSLGGGVTLGAISHVDTQVFKRENEREREEREGAKGGRKGGREEGEVGREWIKWIKWSQNAKGIYYFVILGPSHILLQLSLRGRRIILSDGETP